MTEELKKKRERRARTWRRANPAQREALVMIVEGFKPTKIRNHIETQHKEKLELEWLNKLDCPSQCPRKWAEVLGWISESYRLEGIAIANRAYRLRCLNRLYQIYMADENYGLAATTLDRAAQEMASIPGGGEGGTRDRIPSVAGGFEVVSVLMQKFLKVDAQPFVPGLPRTVRVQQVNDGGNGEQPVGVVSVEAEDCGQAGESDPADPE